MCECPQAYCVSERTARKQHKCYGTGLIINVGEKYTYVSGVWDHCGDSFKFKKDAYSLYNKIARLYEDVSLNELSECVFDGDDIKLMEEYLNIFYKNGKNPPYWMTRRLTEAKSDFASSIDLFSNAKPTINKYQYVRY